MSTLKAKLRGIAEAELSGMISDLQVHAVRLTKDSAVIGETLLRLAAGGKVQVLHNKVIRALVATKGAELLESLSKAE